METWSQTETKVRDFIKTDLKMDPSKIEIERAHRTGRNQNAEGPDYRPRTIVVKFLRYKDREDVKCNAKMLKGTTKHINEDFSSRVIQTRKDLWPRVKAEREKGHFAYLSFDKIIIRPSRPSNATPPV